MSTFAILLLCVQLCLIQNAYGQACWRGPGALTPAAAYAPSLAAPAMMTLFPAATGAYGGAGIGDLAIIGELPVAGTTAVKGQVPILGAVQFDGPVPATGSVTITGSCACNRAYI